MTRNSLHVFCIVACISSVAAERAARADERLRLDLTSPNPLQLPTIEVRLEGFMSKLGVKCGEDVYTSKQPALTFEITEALADLRVTIVMNGNVGAFVLLPDGKYYCSDNSHQILSANESSAQVATYDYRVQNARVDLLSNARPAQVYLPEKPRTTEIDTFDEAVGNRGPKDEAALDAVGKLRERYSNCEGDYMSKHDPTWGHQAEVYVRRGSKVENVKDRAWRGAEKKCGWSRVESAQNKFIRRVNGSLAERRKTELKAVRKRFGL